MGGGGEFLAGLMSGIGDSYARASEEKRRVDLTKKQLEQQDKQFQLQLAEASAARADRNRLEANQQNIALMLGLRGQNIDLTKIASSENQADLNRLHDLAVLGVQAKYRAGDRAGAAADEAALTKLRWALGEISADRAPGRAAAQAGAVARATLPVEKELMGERNALAKDLATFQGEDLAGKIKLEGYRAATELKGALVASKLNSVQDAEKVSQRINENVIGSMAAHGDKADAIASAITQIRQAAKDIASGDQGRSLKAQRALAPLTEAAMTFDPNDPNSQKKLDDAMTQFIGADTSAEAAPSGGESVAAPGAGTPEQQFTRWAQKNPGKASMSGGSRELKPGDSIRELFSVPGLKELAIKAWQASDPEALAAPQTKEGSSGSTRLPSDAILDDWVMRVINQTPGGGTPIFKAAQAFNAFDFKEWGKPTGKVDFRRDQSVQSPTSAQPTAARSGGREPPNGVWRYINSRG